MRVLAWMAGLSLVWAWIKTGSEVVFLVGVIVLLLGSIES